jgi:endoglucanase
MANRYSCWARSQIKYILGDCGRSYVAGYGSNPPTHVHHRGASCLLETGGLGSNTPTCDYNDFNLATANPNIIYGALVGGMQGYSDTAGRECHCESLSRDLHTRLTS